jgi:uncharacterized protein YndB with AHSA1/START domain
MLKTGILAIALLMPALVRGDVADSAANGFTIKLAINIQATPTIVYDRLVHNVYQWWNPMHTFTGDARNLTIDDNLGGCFCEKRPNGAGGIRHMEVINVEHQKTLVLRGTLGPLQSLAATGTLTIQLAPSGDATKLGAVYAVGGYMPNGMNTWAAPVNEVLTEQFTRLKALIETGRPDK